MAMDAIEGELRVTVTRLSLVVFLGITLAGVTFPVWGACNIIGGKAYGDCSSVKVNTEVSPAIVVTDFRSVSGIIAGATVRHGGHLTVNGVSGPIIVEDGGALSVRGVVNGSVNNAGGSVDVSGMVNGVIVMQGGKLRVTGVIGGVSGTGQITYEPGAVVGGVPQE
jgi:hypothetical protein